MDFKDNLHQINYELLQCFTLTSRSAQKSLNSERASQLCKELAIELVTLKYRPGQYTRFAITDPKLREIYAPCFKDRLAQNWLVMHFNKGVEKTLIDDTYANRINKGTMAAILRTQHFMRQPGNNYYLQLDIHNFFGSIYLPRLMAQCDDILERYYHLHPLKHLIHHLLKQCILWHVPSNAYTISGDRKLLASIPQHRTLAFSGPERGLPLGSAASQMLANLYLSPLDHFIKHKLKIKGYVRYMDDLILFGDSPKRLSIYREEIKLFVEDELFLRIHPTKQVLQACHQGANYLGYYTYPHFLHIRKRNISNLMNWIHYFNQSLSSNKSTSEPNAVNLIKLREIQAIINSYLGLMKHARQYRLRRKIYHHKLKLLKKFFIPSDNNYTSLRIRKRFIEENKAQWRTR